MTTQYWLVKQEPEDYAWTDFVRDGRTAWTGVRNYAARNNLKAMRTGDEVLFYHSGDAKAVVGLARVVRTAYPDPTADEDGWVAVDLAPVEALPAPVTLAQVKADAALQEIALVRQSRLSVMPLRAAEFARIRRLARA
ncbi:MAG: EVE domain-containing protein [Candidatus Didemnitutus sp.]|nr:EVE domain-containing protein [Candidatus Didemnitutus sp.]